MFHPLGGKLRIQPDDDGISDKTVGVENPVKTVDVFHGFPIRKGNVLIRYPPLLVLYFCFFKHLIDVSGKQEAALRNLITRSVKDHAESTQCLF